jgi:hypothetical protein
MVTVIDNIYFELIEEALYCQRKCVHHVTCEYSEVCTDFEGEKSSYLTGISWVLLCAAEFFSRKFQV